MRRKPPRPTALLMAGVLVGVWASSALADPGNDNGQGNAYGHANGNNGNAYGLPNGEGMGWGNSSASGGRVEETVAAPDVAAPSSAGLPASEPVVAQADPPPGNNGTVKVHEEGTPPDDRRNEPKVCNFNVSGFQFDPNQPLILSIVPHGGANVAGTGSYGPLPVTAGPDGALFHDPNTVLPDGMYRLLVETGVGGGQKQKVFKVDCPPFGSGTGTGTGVAGASAGRTAGGVGGVGVGADEPGGLAMTGASSLKLALIGALLVAIGLIAMYRGRRRRQPAVPRGI